MDDDGDDKDDTKRRSRNLSEKKRRDQFNLLVNELGTMVSNNNRKMDKSTILKSTISFLKNHNELTVRSRANDISEDWKPAFLSNEEFTYLVLEALEGFVMVFSASGRIYYVSESITSLLGHNPAELVMKSVFDLTYEEDRQTLYNMLQSPGAAIETNHSFTSENEIKFQCHLRRGVLDISEEASYELVQFSGHFRKNMEPLDNDEVSNYGEQTPRLLFVCTCMLQTPQLIRDVSLADSNRNEFTSRHSLEWKFLFLDHRAPPIIGYLPFEVLGTSGYDYYHFDDLEKVTNCHEALMQKGELTSCYYRFLTKGQQWIWLQSRFYITYHQWNSKPEFVVCTHRVVSYADMAKSTKQEEGEVDTASEGDTNPFLLKEPMTENSPLVVSPSYNSETSEAFSSYQPHSQESTPGTAKSPSVGSTAGTMATTATATTASTAWSHAAHTRYTNGSDTASISGDSRSSQRNESRENEMIDGTNGRYYGGSCDGMVMYPNKGRPEPSLVPQHGVGAQYLEPAPYVGTVSGMLPLPLQSIHPVPVIVSSDQVQLQRKHEELKQMIVRQQEELRQVKEQLLLARLGILQPLINVPAHPYANTEEVQHQHQQNPNVPASVIYDGTQPRPPPGYMPQPPDPSDRHPPHMPQ